MSDGQDQPGQDRRTGSKVWAAIEFLGRQVGALENKMESMAAPAANEIFRDEIARQAEAITELKADKSELKRRVTNLEKKLQMWEKREQEEAEGPDPKGEDRIL